MIHEAGMLTGGVQRCARCGAVIADYRGAMVLKGRGPLPTGFTPGASIEIVQPNMWLTSTTVSDRAPDCSPPAVAAADLELALRESLRSGYLFENHDEPLDAQGKRLIRVILMNMTRGRS